MKSRSRLRQRTASLDSPFRASPALVWALAVVMILLAATVLRAYHLGVQSLWYDEGNSAAMVGRSLGAILDAAAGDIHPPLYYLVVAGWGTLAGKSEYALRLASALANILTVGVMFRLGARLFGRPTGLLAALLAAINPFQVYYSQEARMYALLALWAALSMWLTVEVLSIPAAMVAGRFNPRRTAAVVAGTVVVNAAGLYTHYTFPFVIAAETLLFALWLARRRLRLHGLAFWAGIQAAALLLFLPWLPTAIHQLLTWPHLTNGEVTAPMVLNSLLYGITVSAGDVGTRPLALLILLGFGMLPPFPGLESPRRLRFSERIGLVIAWALVPLGLSMSGGAIREPNLKFLLPGNLAVMLALARGVMVSWAFVRRARGSGRALTWLLVPAVLMLGLYPVWIGLHNLYFNPAYARDDYRAIAARIRAEAGTQAAVILLGPNQREVFTYYYPDEPGITPLPNDAPIKTALRLVQANSRVYAVYYGELERDPTRKIERNLEDFSFPLSIDWYGNVRLATYLHPANPPATPPTPLDARLGSAGQFRLTGFGLTANALHPGEALGVTLFWQVSVPITERYKIFIHVYAPDGALAAQRDEEPGDGLYRTDTWTPDRPQPTHHGLLLPARLSPGVYRIGVGLYSDPAGRLPVSLNGQPAGDTVILSNLQVLP